LRPRLIPLHDESGPVGFAGHGLLDPRRGSLAPGTHRYDDAPLQQAPTEYQESRGQGLRRPHDRRRCPLVRRAAASASDELHASADGEGCRRGS
jgi:hypothetical protein